MDRDSLALLLAQGVSVEEIGRRFSRHPSTIAYWMAKFGLEAPNHDKHAAKGGIERERLEELVAAGMTTREIAVAVGLGQTAVRYWLAKYGLRTQRTQITQRETRSAAKAAGRLTVTLACARHGQSEFILEGRGYYRCKLCRVERVSQHRRDMKATLVEEAGGRCVLCGYARTARALAFHHLDPSEKTLPVSWNGVTVALDTLRAEARKCILLCANCHAEVEDGVTAVPRGFRPG
jgi:transposase